MSSIQTVDTAKAFGPVGTPGRNMPCRSYPADAPYMAVRNPNYVFPTETWKVLGYVWSRENARQEHQGRLGLLVMGPKGSGKTTLIEQFFQRLSVPVPSYTANKRTTLQDLVGGKTLSGGEILYDEGPLVFAMRNGLPFLLNEMDLMDPGELTGLNDIIERGVLLRDNGEMVEAARGFLFFASMNTRGGGDVEGAYSGTNVMNKALMSRFLKVFADYPTKDVEAEILVRSVPGLQTPEANRFVELANLIRAGYKGESGGTPLEETMSTRELITWVELVSTYRLSRPDAALFGIRLVLTNACEGTSAAAIEQLVQKLFPVA
ncbi:MAG TPA: AAA family ATPase [Rhodanobacteraceae bacterium]|nr:AAA family ATPase [Rhodanobacteraceae bacterium]